MSRHHKSLRGWATARKKALNLAGYRCAECSKSARLEVHHIIDLDRGGAALDQANLSVLCYGCHRLRHKSSPAVHVQGQQEWADYLKGLQHAQT